MKSHIYIVLAMLSLLISETADAQRRVRGRRAVVHREVVVRRTPHAVVVRRAHVRYAGLPRWGTVVNVRPAGAVIVGRARRPYYFSNGIYYSQRGTGYAIVRPHPGIRIRVLPVGYRTIVVGPRNYYYYYGTFYAQDSASKEYDVVAPPEGAVVDALPEGYEVKNFNGSEYYELEGTFYSEVDAPEFEDGVGYEVIQF